MKEPEIEAAAGPTDKDLKKVVQLAREQLDCQAEIERLSKLLEIESAKLKVNMEVSLPTAMDEIGIANYTLSNGAKVEIGSFVQTSITEANKPAAHTWLEKNKLGDLIKRKIEILFGREDVAWAKKFLKDCAQRKKPLDLKTKEWVEPQTLKATVRRMREEAEDNNKNPDEVIPKDIFGVYVARFAKVTVPSEGAGKKGKTKI